MPNKCGMIESGMSSGEDTTSPTRHSAAFANSAEINLRLIGIDETQKS
jgi:hypothetical protein